MQTNRTVEIFLEKHLGHTWNPVSVDPNEYGMLGEPISIMPADSTHKATHYESTLLSEGVATMVAEKLGEFGFTNPEHFTKVDTGSGIVILMTRDAALLATSNTDLYYATQRTPLIGDTGIRQIG